MRDEKREPVIGWHFVGAKLRDGRPIPLDGEWLVFEGPVEMCVSGLHASRDPFDALQYAPGTTLCKVELEDIVEEGSDKLVCRRRKILARRDATEMLRAFAREQALSVAHLWKMPPIVREYLETGNEKIRVAADAAWDATRAAADAARAAAWAAADAARAAAWAAARAAADAAWDATRAAADAARAAAWAAARSLFNQKVEELFKKGEK